MAKTDDERRREEQRDDLPSPAEDPDTSLIGSTDDRSAENRRKGLQKDEENTSNGESDR